MFSEVLFVVDVPLSVYLYHGINRCDQVFKQFNNTLSERDKASREREEIKLEDY